MRSVEHFTDLTNWYDRVIATLGEDGLEVALEEGAGVFEVLFRVGFGGGDALKRFAEDADDPPLLGEGRHREFNVLDLAKAQVLLSDSTSAFKDLVLDCIYRVEDEHQVNLFIRPHASYCLIEGRRPIEDRHLQGGGVVHSDEQRT